MRKLLLVSVDQLDIDITRNNSLCVAGVNHGAVKGLPTNDRAGQRLVELKLSGALAQTVFRAGATLGERIILAAAFQREGQVVSDVKIDRTKVTQYLGLI